MIRAVASCRTVRARVTGPDYVLWKPNRDFRPTGEHDPGRREIQSAIKRPNIEKSTLLLVDLQNDFLHRRGELQRYRSHIARENPDAQIEMPLLIVERTERVGDVVG